MRSKLILIVAHGQKFLLHEADHIFSNCDMRTSTLYTQAGKRNQYSIFYRPQIRDGML